MLKYRNMVTCYEVCLEKKHGMDIYKLIVVINTEEENIVRKHTFTEKNSVDRKLLEYGLPCSSKEDFNRWK